MSLFEYALGSNWLDANKSGRGMVRDIIPVNEGLGKRGHSDDDPNEFVDVYPCTHLALPKN